MYRIETVFCPIDFSQCSRISLSVAAMIAQLHQARLVLLHVVEGEDLRHHTECDEFKELAKSVLGTSTGFDLLIRTGIPVDVILKESAANRADLIVMGTHGMQGIQTLVLASVTRRVMHESTIPVLSIRCSAHRLHSIQRILCATTLDNDDDVVRQLALNFARSVGAELTFVYVARNVDQDREWPAQESEWRENLRRKINTNTAASYVITAGKPAEEIARITQEQDADLLIVGHHTRSPSEYWFLNSVASHLITTIEIPVLIQTEKQTLPQKME